MAVGVARDASGAIRTIIATSEGAGYVRVSVRGLIGADDIVATGELHAEQNIMNFIQSQGWTPLTVAAGRGICAKCAEAIIGGGATLATALRGLR